MLAADLAAALDPVGLLKRAGIEPDAWQGRVLRSASKRQLLMCHRQAGKSIVAAAKALHKAQYKPGSLTLVLSPSERQSAELFRKVMGFNRASSPLTTDSETVLKAEFANGSRIVALPGKEATVRGFSGVDLLIVDEASRVLDDLYASVRPMLAVSKGELIAMTTPFGKRGWFYQEWTQGTGWEKTIFTAEENPRIDPAFLAEERNSLGDWWYRQEYLCEFVDTAGTLFGYDLLNSALSTDVEPLFGV